MSTLPEGLDEFTRSAGWGSDAGVSIEPLPGDASFRRYFRLRRGDETAMLMFAPPPEEDPEPFLRVARYLREQGMRAPDIISADAARGWVLTEDFGDDRVREHIDAHPDREEQIYETAIDALIALHQKPAGPFDPYGITVYQREAAVLTDWYCPAIGLDVDADTYSAAWDEALAPLIARQEPGVTVLRDYHAENIMLPPDGSQGLIDFQDALVGHPAYDLVSLLQDARRDVAPDLERRMLNRYTAATDPGPDFEADYARLGAQRNAKIVGIFTRLAKRDGKERYLSMIPRVWALMERDLTHPALTPVAAWFEANIPQEIRDRNGAGVS